MPINSLIYKEDDPESKQVEIWEFSKIKFNKVNLLVGVSGCGKSRILNIIFNLGRCTSKEGEFKTGHWITEFTCKNKKYFWDLHLVKKDDKSLIAKDYLVKINENGGDEVIVDRDRNKFVYKGNNMPKLNIKNNSVNLLSNEDEIKDIYRLFSHILRRDFQWGALDKVRQYSDIENKKFSAITKQTALKYMQGKDICTNLMLYILHTYQPERYKIVKDSYCEIFGTIQDFKLRKINIPDDKFIPAVFVKEKGVPNDIPISELSSGMQKVLLILTDIMSLPGDCIYLIDEYENSLGINAIDFLPGFINEYGGNNQFIITTHHPYLINNMDINTWKVFNRSGSRVKIKDGSELKEKYGKSKQKAFINLLNDPFYLGESDK